jgi:biopolymer transport protein ExbD
MKDIFPTPAARKARVEIIPLIDVVFFLLATFVLFTLAMERLGAFEVPLPVPRPGPVEAADTAYVDASGDDSFLFRIGPSATPEVVNRALLGVRLREYRAAQPGARIMIGGVGAARFGAAVSILEEGRKAGIYEASFETAPR